MGSIRYPVNMTIARRQQIPAAANAWIHLMSRCVRRSLLCGNDPYSGRNYDHRKQWIVDKMRFLSSIFAVDVAAYAIMGNHYHIVAFRDWERSRSWNAEAVVRRWLRLYPPRSAKGVVVAVSQSLVDELKGDSLRVDRWRDRLADVSWFMRNLNGPIARRANREDDCKGHFWEGRFKSQALLDDTALITCMAYVDLNPIRAGVCEKLEESAYTSIAERLERWRRRGVARKEHPSKPTERPVADKPRWLMGLHDDSELPNPLYHTAQRIGICWQDYVALLEWTGRCIRTDKKGAIPAHVAPVLQRLDINAAHWSASIEHFGSRFFRAIGHISRLTDASTQAGQRWFKGKRAALLLYRHS